MEEGDGDICKLPEGCISHVLSLTSPRDMCRSSLVSSTFRSAASSDAIWERFLPSDYPEILSRAVDPVEFSSKKELYFRLCDSILIDGGKKSFSLERLSGGKCYMLSARELGITWGDTPQYWSWIPLPDSRFSEVAELLYVCWLEIHGKIDSRLLSANTTYKANLIFRLAPGALGLTFPAQETSVEVGAQLCKHTVRLQPDEGETRRYVSRRRRGPMMWLRSTLLPPAPEIREIEALRAPRARNDGWMEMEMGEFFNGEGVEGEVIMSLLEVEGGNWKRGLIIQGIEVRPK